jgi:prolipoprotein diacylglyceryltransferase
MNKVVKLVISIFVGFDIFFACWRGLAELRFALFGEGAIPGGGSALDMALFLIPIFIGYVAGDRLYYFLTYKERREKLRQQREAAKAAGPVLNPNQVASLWEDGDWQDEKPPVTAHKQE